MTNLQSAKDFLRRYRLAKADLARLSDILEEVRTQLGAAGIDYSKVRVQTSPARDPNAVLIARLIDLEERFLAKKLDAADIMEEVEAVIEDVADERHRRILHLRWIEAWNWGAIAEDIGYDVRWVTRLHEKALLDVKKIIEN